MISLEKLMSFKVNETIFKPLNIFEKIQDKQITKALIKARIKGEAHITVSFFTAKMEALYKEAGYIIDEDWDSQGNRRVYIRFRKGDLA